jgi:hypothetical protein
LLFGSDRGLRDGDWKIVSFRGQPWELYNIADDRGESANLSDQHPELVEKMSRTWHQMAAEVLMAPQNETRPVAEAASGHQHPEWTRFTSPQASSDRRSEARGQKTKRPDRLPRARIGTRLTVEGSQLILDCSGDDPGLAFESLKDLPSDAGPYLLEFRIKSQAVGEGELFWTTDANVRLPRGQRLPFTVMHDDRWHDVKLVINERKPIVALRLDPCSGIGQVRIEGLMLQDARGSILQSWP